ncbi:MFS transporter [Streptomyces sp. NPDC048428]|uniref:MFS transporter n=1 Tax=Streptomyces sp. NPDC048428 TaxID=3154503 RepID=UPI00343B8B83
MPRWWVTLLLLGFMLVNFADKALLGLVSKPLSEAFGLDAAGYGHVASGFYFLFSLSAFGVGLLADRVPTRWLLLVLAVIWSVAQVPIIWTTSVAVLFTTRVVLGAAEGPAYGTANHALHKWFDDEHRQLPTSILATGAAIGSVLAAPILTWIIGCFGWRSGFATVALAGVVWCLLWLTVDGEGPAAAPAPAAAPETPADDVSYLRIFFSGTWLGTALLGFAGYWGLALTVAWLPRYLQDGLGYSVSASGYLVALAWVVGGSLTFGTGALSQWLTLRGVPTRRSRGLLSAGMVAVGGVLPLVAVAVPGRLGPLILVMAGLGAAGVVFATGQTLSAEISPVKRRGAVLGLNVAVATLAGVLAPTVTGDLVQAATDPLTGFSHAFVVFSVICLVAAAVGAVIIRPQHDAARLLPSSTTLYPQEGAA